ncbi:NUDIX hydrolase [Jidongwangia harbinensis]|uniref:NUDIX hydrolase n=1 Tax=Jidongwangia harbinensis TaxID=2878561 RepID=UPI001CDA0394|nr:NUDIX domain-containing protein [Jidongwangia harbinensis]MCA2213649.1 NUDIX domain-containing protein [Jidongwangia harbinensis]
MPLRLPPAMVQRAREFDGTPAPARPAATVVLLRPADPGFEVYVLRRVTGMVFGGVYAFPGGGVDPTDRPTTVRTDWPDRLGVPDEPARAVVGAAARELFEEAGVLLAGDEQRTAGDVSGPDWEADRLAVQSRALTLTQLLERRGLRLRDDLLLPWARWVTPEFEPRRFDTWFFVALLPAAQTARDVSGEADRTAWVRPAEADGLAMLPPTRSTLRDLSGYADVADVVAASAQRNAAAPVEPRVELTGDGGAVLWIDQPKRPVM